MAKKGTDTGFCRRWGGGGWWVREFRFATTDALRGCWWKFHIKIAPQATERFEINLGDFCQIREYPGKLDKIPP